jgi:SAM-dependent methyltransferase
MEFFVSVAKTVYSLLFFRDQCDGSLRSAETILPIVFELIQPSSVIDVGCGVGTWLSAAQQLGIAKCLGMDGSYVSADMLQIDRTQFEAVDLSNDLPICDKFDLAICLEVAEHLPDLIAPRLVKDLTRLAPAVLFSAAIPGQTGNGHINEQWQEYWVQLFQNCGYLAIDCIRPRVWDDPNVDYWYAQNALLMADAEYVRENPGLRAAREKTTGPFSVVHPKTLNHHCTQLQHMQLRGVGSWLREAPSVLGRTFHNRIGGSSDSTKGTL